MAVYAEQLIKNLVEGRYDRALSKLYPVEETEMQRERYLHAVNRFLKNYGNRPAEVYSAPGRTELCGNHLDHQNGCVIAAAVKADTVAVIAKNADAKVHLLSEGYPEIRLDLSETAPVPEEAGTPASLIRGMAAGIRARFPDTALCGFDGCLTSRVPSGSGMSSSAAFEILIGSILAGSNLRGIYDTEDALTGIREADRDFAVWLAKAGQRAENIYFGKPSGMMDQIACSVGGLLYMDFKDPENPLAEKLDADPDRAGWLICLTDTGGSHADLTDAYAQIPADMKAVAACFGKDVLRALEEKEFREHIGMLRQKTGDLAVLRAIHFYEESRRVSAAKEALTAGDTERFLALERSSGDSSWKYLQNIYPAGSSRQQQMALALALSDALLQGAGASRVHGGGFAGTIQAFVPADREASYRAGMEKVLGENVCRFLEIRPVGGCRVI